MLGLQTISSRTIDPVDAVVVPVTKFHGGDAYNVIPEIVELGGTVRTLKENVAVRTEARMNTICAGIGAATESSIDLHYRRNYPVTFNHAAETDFAANTAASIAGEDNVDRAMAPMMGGEDFSYMLEARPGAYLFLGAGPGAGLHHAAYDFNDEIAPIGATFFARLVEKAQPVA